MTLKTVWMTQCEDKKNMAPPRWQECGAAVKVKTGTQVMDENFKTHSWQVLPHTVA